MSLLRLVVMLAAALAARPAAADFPSGFLFGTAIAGFQSDMGGDPIHDDAGTDWWVWTHDATNVANGIVSGDVPEDGPGFYDRYPDDIHLAQKRLESNAFRFGIEWSRIFPTSTASVDASGGITMAVLQQLDAVADQAELAHYRAVLTELKTRGMTPLVTLSHFSLPLWIHDPIAARDTLAGSDPNAVPPTGFAGGWLDATTPIEFGKYAAYVAWKLGDLVDLWAPLNEPVVVATSGYVNLPGVLSGNFPPGAFSFTGAIATILNQADAQRNAYDAVHQWDTADADGDGTAASVGLVHNMVFFRANRPNQPVDVAAAQHADYVFNRVWLNATILGDEDANANGVIDPGEHRPDLVGKADFIGVNYYLRGYVIGLGAPITPVIPMLDFLPIISPVPCPSTCSDLGWEVYPNGFRTVLGIAGGYGLPVYVTENGIADAVDDRRAGYIVQHLAVVEQAINDGVADVRGYFHWSLTDNLEWATGYAAKFGLFSFDPVTGKRKLRKSGRVLARIVRHNTVPERLKARYPF